MRASEESELASRTAILTTSMRPEIEQYFLNPPPGSAAERAAAFGIDLTLTLQNLRLTPEERVRKLDDFISGIAKLKASARFIDTSDATAKPDR
jgi:hypothetical protein